MPHLRFRAVKNEVVQSLSASLPNELAQIMNTAEDNFTFEAIPTEFYSAGQASNSYPFVEVLWFERPQDVQDRAAKVITDQLRNRTNAVDIVVVFLALNKHSYYENGEHF